MGVVQECNSISWQHITVTPVRSREERY
ncbi:hypothetical protein GCK32_014909 [Trichostrongylus colubriformis]|uniref:Uncharacterized protein n=1 Tax=Trichostrongylus colubriformis TaxID=6319 RepID=A0AAN8G368_TRICO